MPLTASRQPHQSAAVLVEGVNLNLSDHQRDAYDQLADAYAHAYSEPRSGAFNHNLDPAIPRLLEAVGPVAGLTMRDGGCGEGIVSRLLQFAGHYDAWSAHMTADVAGLQLEALYGGFAGEPFGDDSPEYVFVARL